MAADLEDQVLQELYAWVDKIPLSKPKKNMARDFADGGKSRNCFTKMHTQVNRM